MKRNSRKEKHFNRSRFIKRLDMAEERINELENMSTDLGATYVSKM